MLAVSELLVRVYSVSVDTENTDIPSRYSVPVLAPVDFQIDSALHRGEFLQPETTPKPPITLP